MYYYLFLSRHKYTYLALLILCDIISLSYFCICIIVCDTGISLIDSWRSVGGSPDVDAQWSTVLTVHRSAYTILAKYATMLAGLNPPGEVGSNSLNHKVNTSDENENNDADEDEDDSFAKGGRMEYVANNAVTCIIIRLKKGALYENLATRRCCISGLANLSLQLKDPFKFDIYQFFHELLMNAHERNDIFSKHSGDKNSSSSSSDVVVSGDVAGSLNKSRQAGVNLGVSDLLSSALGRLDEIYAAAAL
jgi:hypothetical protein